MTFPISNTTARDTALAAPLPPLCRVPTVHALFETLQNTFPLENYHIQSIYESDLSRIAFCKEKQSKIASALKILYHPDVELSSSHYVREKEAFKQFNAGQVPHIPKLRATYSDKERGVYILQMDWIDGMALSRVRKLAFDEVVSCGVQILEALSVIHELGFMHADIKPGNLMMHLHQVTLIDFGLSRNDVAGNQPVCDYLYTRPWRAPEAVAEVRISQCSDLWSLGATLFELSFDEPLVPMSVYGESGYDGLAPEFLKDIYHIAILHKRFPDQSACFHFDMEGLLNRLRQGMRMEGFLPEQFHPHIREFFKWFPQHKVKIKEFLLEKHLCTHEEVEALSEVEAGELPLLPWEKMAEKEPLVRELLKPMLLWEKRLSAKDVLEIFQRVLKRFREVHLPVTVVGLPLARSKVHALKIVSNRSKALLAEVLIEKEALCLHFGRSGDDLYEMIYQCGEEVLARKQVHLTSDPKLQIVWQDGKVSILA